MRQGLSSNLREQITDPDRAALALGFLLGEKSGMPEELTQALRAAGLAHVVVASGFALSIITNFAKKYLKFVSRFAIVAGSMLLAVSFVLLSGFSASLLRAGLATCFSLMFWYFGRRMHPVRLLAYVAALSAGLFPEKFLSLGWQLSFASYAGILLLLPPLEKYFYPNRRPGYIATMVLVSISAQLSCLPLSIYNFGSISLLGILSNLIITPLIAPTMALALFLAIGCSFAPIVMCLDKILQLQISIINYVAQIPWATLRIENNQGLYLFLYVPIVGI